MYSLNWSQVPETENLPNNFRTAMAGKEMGINRVRWVHPTVLPPHVHEDAEQAVIVVEGVIQFTIAGESMTLGYGDVAIVPRGTLHSGQSVVGEAVFIEIFAPLRLENLLGFLGEAFVAPEAD